MPTSEESLKVTKYGTSEIALLRRSESKFNHRLDAVLGPTAGLCLSKNEACFYFSDLTIDPLYWDTQKWSVFFSCFSLMLCKN